MFERVTVSRRSSIPLNLMGDGNIVFPSKEPVYGWMAGEAPTGPEEWLNFPQSLLSPTPTTVVTYACNLPSPFAAKGHVAPLDERGTLPLTIPPAFEPAFLRASLPGGQTELFTKTGERGLLKFRWVCLSAERFIGSIWRCYIQVRQRNNASLWSAIERDYFFCSDTGIALGAPSPDTMLTLDIPGERPITLVLQRLTQFECASGRVKVTRLCSDGWGQRELESLRLYPEGNVAAHFSDGKQTLIATAWIERIDLQRAA
jgi:hypothetical protein